MDPKVTNKTIMISIEFNFQINSGRYIYYFSRYIKSLTYFSIT